MSEKPEALQAAESLEQAIQFYSAGLENSDNHMTLLAFAAAELRRQHAKIERLREALTYDWDQLEACRESLREHMVEIKRLREALEKIATVNAMDYEYVRWAKAALRRERT